MSPKSTNLLRLIGLILLALLANRTSAQTLTILGSFNSASGSQAVGSLTLSGSTLYGTARYGGANSNGTVFSLPLSGGSLTTLLSFSGTNGQGPQGSLTLSGSTLYGMATDGGANGDYGTVFKINTDGTGPKTLLSFSGTNGKYPFGDLTLSGSTFYGMTEAGGANSAGNIFGINSDGTGYKNVLAFSGTNGVSNGKYPFGNLTLSGSTFYGMTEAGGTNGVGNIFAVNTDGTGFKNLLSFSGSNGANPFGSLTLGGSTLYGMTQKGGTNSGGNVFCVNTDGTGYKNLLSFSGSNGQLPYGSLTLSGSTLFGMAENGGANSFGNIFRINTDGASFQNLLSFSGSNGKYPFGSLALRGATLYGMTTSGGANGDGTVFALTLPSSVWAQSGSGSWNNPSNWVGNRFPGSSPQDTACFGAVIGSSTAAVSLDGSRMIGGLAFSTSGGGRYLLRRVNGDTTSTLTLAATGTSFSLTNSGGNHTIAAPVTLAADLAVGIAAGASLSMSDISETATGSRLTLNGGGELILSGSDSYTGGTTVNAGTLLVANPAALPMNRGLRVGSGGSVIFRTVGRIANPSYDTASDDTFAGGHASAGSPLAVAPAVAAVPEPSALALLAAAAAFLLGYVWRTALRRRHAERQVLGGTLRWD